MNDAFKLSDNADLILMSFGGDYCMAIQWTVEQCMANVHEPMPVRREWLGYLDELRKAAWVAEYGQPKGGFRPIVSVRLA